MLKLRRQSSVRRRQIAAAARRLIVRYGSEHVTVRRIAREIGVSEGSIYRHFKSKAEILSFLVDEIENVLMAEVEPANGQDSTDFIKRLDTMMKAQLSEAQQRRGVAFQVIAEIVSFGDKKLSRKMYDVIDDYIRHIRAILEDGMKSGMIRGDVDLAAFSTLLFGTMHGLVNLWALSNYSFDLEQSYTPIFTALCQSLLNPK